MIGRLSGQLVEKEPPNLLIDVQGVGYELEASLTTFYALPDVGQSVSLFTHFLVREDAQLLFGFASVNERLLFRQLIKVSGVGAKLALAILSTLSIEALSRCVHEKDSAALVKVPGVGKKTAQRLLVELQDKLDGFYAAVDQQSANIEQSAAMASMPGNAIMDAVSALIALGYKPQEAKRMVHIIKGAETLSSESLIRTALQMTTTL